MPTVFDRLSASVDTGALDGRVAVQVGQLRQAIEIGAGFIERPPAGVDDFVARIGGLAAPSFSVEGGVAASLQGALAALPADLGALTGAATGELGRFTALIETGLMPLLSKAVGAARAIEALLAVDLRCPPAAGAAAPPAAPAGDDEPAQPAAESAGAQRLSAASGQLAQVDGLLAQLPDPLTVGALLDMLSGWTDQAVRNELAVFDLPFLGDVVQPLRTCAQWSAATPADVGAHILASVEVLGERLTATAPGFADALTGEVAALQASLRRPELESFAGAYSQALADIQAAVGAGDLAAVAARTADLDTAITGFEALRADMAGDFTALVPALRRRLADAPGAMLDGLGHLIVQLEPLNPVATLSAALPAPAAASDMEDELRALLKPATDVIENLVEVLDFTSIEGDVATVATEAQQIADAVSNALTDVALDVRASFEEVGDAVAGAGLDDLAGEIRGQITAAGDALETGLVNGFAPMRSGLADAIQALADALDGFNPQDVVAALEEVVQAIAGVLAGGEVKAALDEVRAAIGQVSATFETLSFAPVTDEVIALIEKMAEGLRALGDTDLNDAVKGMLQTAMQVLPDSLEPVTEPLVVDFGALVETGPVALLERVRAKPQLVLDRVRSFEPARLIGPALSAPYRELLGKAEAFTPSALLAPVRAELDAQKRRIVRDASPGRALEPLVAQFDALLARIDQYAPSSVLAPLEDEVERAIQGVVEASPVDEILAVVDRVFATIEEAMAVIDGIVSVLTRIEQALTALSESDAQIDAWRDSILDKVEAIPNLAEVTVAKVVVDTAITASRHGEMVARTDAALAPIEAELAGLAAGQRLNDMVLAHQRLRAGAATLAESPARAALFAALDRFDPMAPAHSGPLRAAAELRQGIAAMRTSFAGLAAEWAGVVDDPNGTLAEIRGNGLDAVALRRVVADELEPDLRPARILLGHLAFLGAPVGGLVAVLNELVANVAASLGNILTGPASLQSIADAVQQVVDVLRNIDLSVLSGALDSVFQEVRGQIAALGPRPLVDALDREFRDLVDAIDLDLVLPAAEIAALDASFQAVLDKLRALDPEALITEAVQPTFEAEIVPLIDGLDLTPAFDALIAALKGLDQELRSELGRVNTAYQSLLAARPGGASASISVSF